MALTKKNFNSKVFKILTNIETICGELNAKFDPDKSEVTITDENGNDKVINMFGGRIKRLILPPLKINDNYCIQFGVLGNEFALFDNKNDTVYMGDMGPDDFKYFVGNLIWDSPIRNDVLNNLLELNNRVKTMTREDFTDCNSTLGLVADFGSNSENQLEME